MPEYTPTDSPEPGRADDLTARLDRLVDRLDLETKVRLLTGRDFWTTRPNPEIGLRSIVFSDGPSGVRGEVWDERSPSLNLPSATTLSSSWDLSIASRYGAMLGSEARRKGVDVVLGPTINLHRSPLGGRHFEAFSEDPLLTAELAAAWVDGMQSTGVGATPKHYVANDFETDRFTVDVKVDDRTLRELYLRAFEDAVTRSRAWAVMSAYNSVNGATLTENELLETPLNTEWGFDGIVVSDWTAVRSVSSAAYAQDLVMPGPDGPWGEALVTAVEQGRIPREAIDRKVRRLLRLAARVGALEGFEASVNEAPVPEDGAALAREVAVEGAVLLKNDGVLPLQVPARIAVIGHNARRARTQGGGSATVIPAHVVSPLDGIEAAFPGAEVVYALGAVVQEGLAELDREAMRHPGTGEPGALVEMLDADGHVMHSENRASSALVYFGGTAPVGALTTLVFTTDYTPPTTERVRLGFASVGKGRVFVDDELLVEDTTASVSGDLGAALLTPPAAAAPMDMVAGRTRRIRVELRPGSRESQLGDVLGLTVGTEPAEIDGDALIAEAVDAARNADVAVVVVGTNSRVESEGYDRRDLHLPGRQDDLVRAVTAANRNTVVIVNSGAPVLLPWRNEAAAVLATYFGGQEYGHALGDLLSGDAEPGGRLPTTWPTALAETPVLKVAPDDGVVAYSEGIHIGYRAWLREGVAPAYAFGSGLGYTTWEITDCTAESDGNEVRVSATVANTGAREGKHVVQVYAERPDSAVERPMRWLVGFTVVRLAAGSSTRATVRIPTRSFAHWADGWHLEPGRYLLKVGSSVDDLPQAVSVTL